MRIASLSLQQFRSYPELTIEFSEDATVHVLLGPNAAGKTNVLESVALLSLTKSCQGTDEQNLMHWGSEFYRVRAEAVADDGEQISVEIASQTEPRKKKVCFRNDVEQAIGSMVGTMPTVLFLPQDLDLFTGAPQQRRQFFDQLLCQVSPEYLQTLVRYQRVLKQRNSLLRKVNEGKANISDLGTWDPPLAQEGAYLTQKRLELIELLQCTLVGELLSLGEDWPDAQIIYDRKTAEQAEEAIREELLSLLRTNWERDRILQATTVGPHREDWYLEVRGRALPSFASRGQQRTAVLALLFLQVSFLELRRGEKPIVLLDDVFSELDDTHQSALLESLEGHQVFITTTHLPSQIHGAAVWEVGKGKMALSSKQ